MLRENGDVTSTAAPPLVASDVAPPYQPPAVEWEEEFDPVAASVCPPGELCPDGMHPVDGT